MRIFYVTSEYIDPQTHIPFDGGLAQYLYKITLALSQRGHDISVICYGAPEPLKITWNEIDIFFVPYGRFRKSFIQHLIWPFLSPERRLDISTRSRMRTISETLRIEHARCPIDIVQYASYRGLGRYPVSEIPSCVRISSYAKLWLSAYKQDVSEELRGEIEQFRYTRFLYGPSRLIAEAIERDVARENPIDIIETPFVAYSGEESESLLNELKTRLNGHEYILFFGTIGLLKGAGEIAGAVDRILRGNPKLDLVLVGKAIPSDGFDPIEEIRRAAGANADRVHWFDRQPKKTLMPIVRAAKAVLLPSRVDNLPNTCIESMGCGKIVIGSRGASFDQLIDDGVNGLLCQAGNADSVVEAVDRLMSMPSNRVVEMEREASRIKERLSLDAIVPQVEAYYCRVIREWERT